MTASEKTIDASLVIPVYNNEKTLVKMLLECEKILKNMSRKYEIIVSEDKSTDSSASLLRQHFAKKEAFRLFFNKKNLGISKNIKKLYKNSKNEYVVLFSVDGDWNPKDIAKLLIYAKKHRLDIVIGKRKYTSYPIHRKIVSYLYNALPVLLFGIKTIDAGSIKVIRRKLISEIKTRSKSVFFEAEFIIKASKRGKKIGSMPISFRRRNKKPTGARLGLVISSLFDLVSLRLKMKDL